MTSLRITIPLLAICLASGCGQSRHEARNTMNASSNAVVQGNAIQPSKVRLDSFFRAKGITLDTVLASQGNYIVLVVSRRDSSALITVVHDAAGIQQVGPEVQLDQIPYPRIKLMDLGSGEVLRVMTFDDLTEDVVGTAVDRMTRDRIYREFADPTNGCKAADFTTHDGVYTLYTYVKSPFSADCLSQCAETLRAIMGTEPAQIVVLNRVDGVWKQARAVVDTAANRGYAKAAMALSNGKVPECSSDSAHILRSIKEWQQAPS